MNHFQTNRPCIFGTEFRSARNERLDLKTINQRRSSRWSSIDPPTVEGAVPIRLIMISSAGSTSIPRHLQPRSRKKNYKQAHDAECRDVITNK
jgi:hypothetical protein